jgi:lysophospholipase L1-like esterase
MQHGNLPLNVLFSDAPLRSNATVMRALLLAITTWGCLAHAASADSSYIDNLVFTDRSPGSPRANSFEATLRLDANDASFAGAAGWGGGLDTWQKQFDHTKTLGVERSYAGLAFLGDSVTQGWGAVGGRQVNSIGASSWKSPEHNFGKYGALNFGIAGDQTQNIIYRVENGELDNLNPGLIVLMIGTNNLFAPTGNPGFPAADYVGPAHTAEEVADGVLATVQAIREHAPNANILTLSTLRGLNNADPDRIAANAANALVKQAFDLDTNPKLHYLDFANLFRNANGTINANMNGDGVHFTAAGYEAWADAIQPFVNQYAATVADAFLPNVAPRGVASWTNSVDGSFGHYAFGAIDGDLTTMNHGDFNGSSGGNAAAPDVFTLELDKTYNLANVEIVNRGSLDGGSAVSDARLTGTVLQVLGANGTDVLFTTTLADDPTQLGETLAFDNGGTGFVGAKFIRLTANNFLHIRELRANVATVPEPASATSLGAAVLGLGLLLRTQTKSLLSH